MDHVENSKLCPTLGSDPDFFLRLVVQRGNNSLYLTIQGHGYWAVFESCLYGAAPCACSESPGTRIPSTKPKLR